MPSPPTPAEARPLVYEQVRANERRVRLLLVTFGIVVLPAAFWIVHQVAAYLALLLFPAAVGYEAVVADPAATIAIAAFLAVQVTVLACHLAYRSAVRRVLRLTGARPLGPDEAPLLRRTVENLCIGSGLPEPALAMVDSPAINACSTGLDPAASTLVVTRGAMARLDRRELEGILAHELVQIEGHDTRLGTVVAGLVQVMWLPLSLVGWAFGGLAAMLRHLGLGSTAIRGCLLVLGLWIGLPLVALFVTGMALGLEMLDDPVHAMVFLVLMTLPLYVLLVAPVVGLLMLRAISRERVWRADANALLLTRNPGALARAFAKMSAVEHGGVAAAAAARPLWVTDPAPPPRHLLRALLTSHPALDDRLARLAAMSGVTAHEVDAARRAATRVPPKEGER